MMHTVVPVVDDGKVLGVVRRRVIEALSCDEPIGGHVEDAPLVGVLEPVEVLAEVAEFYEGSLIPLVDRHGMLVGMAPPPTPDPGA
jgi:Mg/Co/Ni transporter MgtE